MRIQEQLDLQFLKSVECSKLSVAVSSASFAERARLHCAID
jgi:hypothetical protein